MKKQQFSCFVQRLFSPFFLVNMFVGITLWACTSDQLPEPVPLACADDAVSYDNQIQPLVEQYCSIPQCHDSGSAFGDYTSYASMSSILDENGFEQRVINTPDGNSLKMPPPNSTPINETDLELFQCWINQEYDEN